ncbi:hypothetical protein D9M71_667690 [compost metagenome]
MRDLFPTDGVEGCPNLDEIEEVQLTAATDSKVTEQQAVGRSERTSKNIAVLGAGQTGFGKAARRIMGQIALEKVAKQIAFATPEMLGELGREQAREEIADMSTSAIQGVKLTKGESAELRHHAVAHSLAGGRYGSRK